MSVEKGLPLCTAQQNVKCLEALESPLVQKGDFKVDFDTVLFGITGRPKPSEDCGRRAQSQPPSSSDVLAPTLAQRQVLGQYGDQVHQLNVGRNSDGLAPSLACLGQLSVGNSNQVLGELEQGDSRSVDKSSYSRLVGLKNKFRSKVKKLFKGKSNVGKVQIEQGIVGKSVQDRDVYAVNFGEGKNRGTSSPSWTSSQVVNEAMARFQNDCQDVQHENESQYGSKNSEQLNDDERAELENLRQLVAGLNLHETGEQRGNYGQGSGEVAAHVASTTVPQPASMLRQQDLIDLRTPVERNLGESASETLGPTLTPKEVKLERPGVFKGRKADVDNFIFEMKQYVDSTNLGNGSKACRFLVSHLKEDALTWWRSFAKDGVSIFDNLTLDVLLNELKRHFSDLDEERTLTDKILNLRQTESVQKFINEFKMLQLRLGSAQLSDGLALHIFMKGLRPLTRQQVVMQDPTSLEDAFQAAMHADQNLSWGFYGQRRNDFHGASRNKFSRQNVSQYSNIKTQGPVPMVLGAVQNQNGNSGAGKATVTCYHCGKVGHYKRDCWKLNGKPTKNSGKQVKKLNVVSTESKN